ncbi:MAG: DUF2865 domain-containing protein [Pseudomonadota bacterium]
MRWLGILAGLAVSVSGFMIASADDAAAQSATCRVLESRLAQLTSTRSSGGSAKKYANAAVKQKRALSRAVNQARRAGCGGAFFRSRRNASQCRALEGTIREMRSNLAMLERRAGRGGRSNNAEIRRVRNSLARNRCGQQHRVIRVSRPANGGAAIQQQPRKPAAPRITAPKESYRTVCVRTCDGYFFPVSFSTTKGNFRKDAARCEAASANSETQLFVFKLPEGTLESARTPNGEAYTSLANAFRYQREFVNGCSFYDEGIESAKVEIKKARIAAEQNAGLRDSIGLPTTALTATKDAVPETLVNTSENAVTAQTQTLLAFLDGAKQTPAEQTGVLASSVIRARALSPEEAATLPDAKMDVRDVFARPNVTQEDLNSRAVVRYDVYPPMPIPRPSDRIDGTVLAAADEMIDEDALRVGGEYFLHFETYPPLPFKRPDPLAGRQLSEVR